MRILISTAIWGRDYCSIFTRFSLATMLSPGNIPKLAQRATITFHIFTTNSDQRHLVREPAIAELQRYCTIEWEIIEHYILYRPPVGPGGDKYPFLSALQNIAITRSLDQDAIVFNYADFIWADGTLTAAAETLLTGEKPFDAVLGFCLPVDRDLALPALNHYRQTGPPGIIDLKPRDAAKIAVERMHREAKIRLWEGQSFTNLPTYLLWQVDGQGILIRAYHQSILAMRVRRADPQYCRGIIRGSLDACLTAQLAESGSISFATDTDRMLIFSLYHTPVDSRIPAGETREMSLRNMLQSVATPGQRRFAEQPIFVRTGDGDEAAWNAVAASSWELLRNAHATIAFDQAAYDKNYETHGLIPKISKQSRLNRFVLRHIHRFAQPFVDRIHQAVERTRRIIFVLGQPPLLRAALLRRCGRMQGSLARVRRIVFVLSQPPLLRAALLRRCGRPTSLDKARLRAAIAVEDMTSRIADPARLLCALRKAEELLRRAIKSAPVWAEPVRALGRNLWFQSRFGEAIEVFAKAEDMRKDMALAAGWPTDTCLFLPRNCVESIGLMGHLDAFVKYKRLTKDSRQYYLLAPPQKTVNPAFLDYWKEHLTVISHREEIEKLAPLEAVYGVNWNWVMPKKGGGSVFLHKAMAEIQREWELKGGQPLLQLRQDHAERLRQAQATWGMAPGEAFVCLHVRSVGFYGESRETAQQFRNTSIDSYYPLIRTLGEIGLWVIRMGDASMPPLNLEQCGDSGRVIDYALSPERSAELDVALCAECELFVSSPSGLHTVAHAFGRPVCEVNYPIYHGFPWHPGEIFIPQLYYSQAKNRALTLEEILGSDIVHCDHHFLLERAGISLIPNEPDDMIETVREALSPSTYQVENIDAADRVIGVFDDLNRHYDRGISGRLGRYFAMKHASRLLAQQEHAQMASARIAC